VESSNSLVYTGTADALQKVRELVTEIDAPLRQVLLDMLILDTTLADSLTYGVSWGSAFGGGNQSGTQSFLPPGKSIVPIPGVLNSASIQPGVTFAPNALPLTSNIAGYSLGVVGAKLTHNGTEYMSIAALVQAIHDKDDINIISNPKILAEDNV